MDLILFVAPRSSWSDAGSDVERPDELLDLNLQQQQYCLHHRYLEEDQEERQGRGAHDCRQVRGCGGSGGGLDDNNPIVLIRWQE